MFHGLNKGTYMSGGKKCSGCVGFIKRKNDRHSSGICNIHDARTNSDHCCSKWSPIPYDRSTHKIDVKTLEND